MVNRIVAGVSVTSTGKPTMDMKAEAETVEEVEKLLDALQPKMLKRLEELYNQTQNYRVNKK